MFVRPRGPRQRATLATCYWIDGRKLQYIGHGPQLSDEQFAEVERLFAEQIKLDKIAKDYSERTDALIYDGNVRRQPDRSQKRQVDEPKPCG